MSEKSPMGLPFAIQSLVEEALSLLTLIAALMAWSVGIKWLAWLLFIKAALDTAISLKYAYKHLRCSRKEEG